MNGLPCISSSGGPLPPCTVTMRAPLVLISVRVKPSNIDDVCSSSRRSDPHERSHVHGARYHFTAIRRPWRAHGDAAPRWAIRASNSSGVMIIGSTPSLASFSFTAGSSRPFTVSW